MPSALGALLFGEPQAEEIAKALGRSPMAAPALIWFELASVCLRKIKAHPPQRENLLMAFALAGKLPIDIVEVDLLSVIQIAEETGLTTYDASYLWLAREIRGELITLDVKLKKAAAR